ncbi:MAG: DUF456 domain-containing protein [Planctomycetota bacterium]
MEYVWLGCAWLILALAMVGSILPVLPGPPIAYGAVLLMDWSQGWTFSWQEHAVMIFAIVAVTALDFVVPAIGAKKFGAGKLGMRMSVVGMFVGLFFFPPFGLFLGGAVGALIGESMAGKRNREALRAAWGVLVGTVAGTVLKLLVVLLIGLHISGWL